MRMSLRCPQVCATGRLERPLQCVVVILRLAARRIMLVPHEWTLSYSREIVVVAGAKRFRCVEVSLQPNFIGKGASGFRDTSFQFIAKCDVDIRKEFFANVVLTALAPPTMRSRWLLRFGMDWRIRHVFPHLSAGF